MKCPTCNTTHGVEIDIHADGYARNVLECADCGSVWVSSFGTVTVLKRAA